MRPRKKERKISALEKKRKRRREGCCKTMQECDGR
jgi:hypothetical protein